MSALCVGDPTRFRPIYRAPPEADARHLPDLDAVSERMGDKNYL
jgi:hypothetical protein